MKYIDISNTLFNAPFDSEGEQLDYITFSPCVTVYLDPGISITNYSWNFLEIQSNFKNATGLETDASINTIASGDTLNPVFRLSNIKDGEVVFLNLGFEFTFSDGDTRAGRVNITLYRGDPINTSFAIQTHKNGRLIKEYIYDRPIEEQMNTANSGDIKFFEEIYNTIQGQKLTISEYLIKKQRLAAEGKSWKDVAERDTFKDKDGNEVDPATNNNDEYSYRTSVSFIKNELALYAHGRSQDLASIKTLFFQNPKNFFNANEAPNIQIYENALNNWLQAPPGANTFISPLINPYLGQKAKLYFPGRSSHGGGSGGKTCTDVTVDFTWTPPTYPPDCKPGSGAFICQGSHSLTIPYCVQETCTSC
jgi:hypothetical protein